MVPRIELLKQAGFSDAEIADWATAERQRMHDAGFAEDEIDAEFGVTRPPAEPPQAFVERNAAQRIAGAAGEYARRYFGDEPLGFSPRNEAFLRRLGPIGDIVIPAAKPVDAVLRAVPAGIGGLGAGIGQAVEEAEDATIGHGPQASGKAARDFAELAQIAAILSGAGRGGPAPVRAPAARMTAAPALALPAAEDFRNAAAVITGRPSSFSTEQKLLQLYKERGLTPVEVAQEARRNPALAAELASDSGRLPDAPAESARQGAKAGATETAATAAEHTPPPAAREPAAPAEADRPASPGPGPHAPAAEERPIPELLGQEPTMVAQSKDVMAFPPPRIWQRPFSFDYRKAPQTDGTGQLPVDIEGRPLTAQYVAGRRFAWEDDQPLSAAEIKDALNRLDIRLLSRKKIPGQGADVVGEYVGYQLGKRPVGEVYVKSRLTPQDRDLVIAHEFGHALDHFTRTVSNKLTPAEIDELRRVYPTLRAGGPRKSGKPQPEDFNYTQDQVNRELVAEGFRAYVTNPNYFKAYAPRAAAKFRAAVNRNRYLKRVIQLNSLGGAGLITAAGLGRPGTDQEEQ